jgi:hypothetical protein
MAHRRLAALLVASLLFPLTRPDSTSSLPATTAYDEIHLQDFPCGLLLANAHAYTLDAGSRDFAIDLRFSYRIVLPAGSYVAAFSDRLTGCLDDRCISGLDGIRVKAFFRWWSITGTGDLLSLYSIELYAGVELHNDELHSSKQQGDIAQKARVASICFK